MVINVHKRTQMIINVHKPIITIFDLDSVMEVVRKGDVCNGEERELFEKEFARFIGTKYAVATSSGSTALHLALEALGITKGDEVIVPALTYVATGNAVLYTGAKPVVVDVDLGTWNISPEAIEKAITKKTKAIIVVHLYGNPAPMDKIMEITKKHNLYVIEDAAEAHGAWFEDKRVGSIGDIGCFSFYGNKMITTGEGGMVTTNKKELAKRVKHLKGHCMTKRYYHDSLGYNYEMSNLNAALGRSQLSNIRINERVELYQYYARKFDGMEHSPLVNGGVNWLFTLLVAEPEKLAKKLLKAGIETRPVFTPLNMLPHFKNTKCDIAEYIYRNGISIPTRTDLTTKELDYIVTQVYKFK